MGGSVMVPMTVPQGLRGVTSNHFCVLSGPPPSWALAEESPNYKTFVFSDICYLLLAHCFGGECHTNICRGSRLCTFWHYYSSLSWRMSPSVTSPIFFFSFFFMCIGAAQVHTVIHAASGRLQERVQGLSCLVSPSFLCFCVHVRLRLLCLLSPTDSFCTSALWWEPSLILDHLRTLLGHRALKCELFHRNVCWLQFLPFLCETKAWGKVSLSLSFFSCVSRPCYTPQHFNAGDRGLSF